jgi:hypothetical protein
MNRFFSPDNPSWKRLKIAKGESEEGGHILQWKKEKEQKDKE